jgi:hypothetical protein
MGRYIKLWNLIREGGIDWVMRDTGNGIGWRGGMESGIAIWGDGMQWGSDELRCVQLQVVCIWLMQVTCIYVGHIHFVHSVHSFHFLMKLASHLHLSFASPIFQSGMNYAYSASIFFLFLETFLLHSVMHVVFSHPCNPCLSAPILARLAIAQPQKTK